MLFFFVLEFMSRRFLFSASALFISDSKILCKSCCVLFFFFSATTFAKFQGFLLIKFATFLINFALGIFVQSSITTFAILGKAT